MDTSSSMTVKEAEAAFKRMSTEQQEVFYGLIRGKAIKLMLASIGFGMFSVPLGIGLLLIAWAYRIAFGS